MQRRRHTSGAPIMVEVPGDEAAISAGEPALYDGSGQPPAVPSATTASVTFRACVTTAA